MNQVTIGNGFDVQVNVPGDQMFNAAGSDVFQSIADLITALRNNSRIDTAVASVRGAFDYITASRVFYGNVLNQIEGQQTYAKNEQLQLKQQENTVAGADITAVASQLVNAENSRDATLAAVGEISQGSLFDYI